MNDKSQSSYKKAFENLKVNFKLNWAIVTCDFEMAFEKNIVKKFFDFFIFTRTSRK